MRVRVITPFIEDSVGMFSSVLYLYPHDYRPCTGVESTLEYYVLTRSTPIHPNDQMEGDRVEPHIMSGPTVQGVRHPGINYARRRTTPLIDHPLEIIIEGWGSY